MNTKTFTVVITSPFGSIYAHSLQDALKQAFPGAAIQIHEVNKTSSCDGCEKERRDVKSCGRDSNGEPDAPSLCFICRVEGSRGRVWSSRRGRYVSRGNPCGNISLSGIDL